MLMHILPNVVPVIVVAATFAGVIGLSRFLTRMG